MYSNKNANLTSYTRELLDSAKDVSDEMVKEAETMSAIGVCSEDDHKDFLYVLLHTRKIANDISGQKLSSDDISKISHIVFSNRTYKPIDTIFNFYRAVGDALGKVGIPFKKVAYPSGQSMVRSRYPRDVNKWMQSMSNIYIMVHKGMNYNDALSYITADWDVMEKIDFQNWMKFYQEGAHEKYKTADANSGYLETDDGVPMIPFDHLRGKLNSPPGIPNMDRIISKQKEDEEKAAEEAERLEVRDKKVKSIGSRFRSLLKLLSDSDVQEALDGKLDVNIADFVKQVQDLQRYILLIPINSKNAQTIEDVIIQRGNKIAAQGFPKAGALIKKLAQDPGRDRDAPEGRTPPPPTVEDVKEKSEEKPEEELKDIPAPEGDLPEMPSDTTFEDEGDDAWVNDFKDNLNGIKDDSDVDDVNDVDDMAEITVEAQALPDPTPALEPEAPAPIPDDMAPGEEVAIEVEEPQEVAPPIPVAPKKELKEIGDLNNVTITDIVDRLERVSNILKNREIPRELAWIDFMLDKKGLASYFPELAEATKSALESNQYMSTRVESMLSALRGSIEPEEPIELATTEEEEVQTEDTLNQVRKNLEDKEKNVKKEPAPAIPIEEVSKPVDVKPSPPMPIR